MNKIDSIIILQQWYESNCNNDWEHQYGIKIETLDNPGWSVCIDTTNTPLEGVNFSSYGETNRNSWYDIKTHNNVFIGYGSNLSDIIQIFYTEFLMPNLPKSDMLFTVYFEFIHKDMKIWRPILAKMVDLIKFKVVNVPNIEIGELLVRRKDDWQIIDFNDIKSDIVLKKEMIVTCHLEQLCDGVVLVVD
ncbi:MAG: immunity 53 family protein [Saprospiraceae bacterium]|nr:immunity 53 family protein [Saprospiraceae bacterium]